MTSFHRTLNIVARGLPNAHGVELMKGTSRWALDVKNGVE